MTKYGHFTWLLLGIEVTIRLYLCSHTALKSSVMAPGFGLHLDGSENIAFLFRTYMSAQEATLPVYASHFLDNFFYFVAGEDPIPNIRLRK